jgi:diguanylate cyclase (GGDEF)-like protein
MEPRLRVASVCSLTELLAVLAERKPDVLVLDLSLPEGEGLEALRRVQALSPGLPVVILSTLAEAEIARRALETGASDYLLKGHIDHRSLLRALQCMLWRGHEAALAQHASLMDELTGLFTRDAFLRLAVRHFDEARRQDAALALLCVDVDGLEGINREHGRREGDRILFDTAELLRKSFRRTDLIGRTGSDEFAVLAVDAAEPSAPILRQRVERRVQALNQSGRRLYQVSLSIGVHLARPARGGSLQDLFLDAEADLQAHRSEHSRRGVALADSIREACAEKERQP